MDWTSIQASLAGNEDAKDEENDTISLTSTRVDAEPEDCRYVVRRILAERTRSYDGTPCYLLEWEGYDVLEATWEPEANLDSQQIVDDWTLQKLKVARGFEPAFDIQDHERKVAERNAAITQRRALRRIKRRQAGWNVPDSPRVKMEPGEPDEPLDRTLSTSSDSSGMLRRTVEKKKKASKSKIVGGFVVKSDSESDEAQSDSSDSDKPLIKRERKERETTESDASLSERYHRVSTTSDSDAPMAKTRPKVRRFNNSDESLAERRHTMSKAAGLFNTKRASVSHQSLTNSHRTGQRHQHRVSRTTKYPAHKSISEQPVHREIRREEQPLHKEITQPMSTQRKRKRPSAFNWTARHSPQGTTTVSSTSKPASTIIPNFLRAPETIAAHGQLLSRTGADTVKLSSSVLSGIKIRKKSTEKPSEMEDDGPQHFKNHSTLRRFELAARGRADQETGFDPGLLQEPGSYKNRRL